MDSHSSSQMAAQVIGPSQKAKSSMNPRIQNTEFTKYDSTPYVLSYLYKEVEITYRLLIGNWLHFVTTYYVTLLTRILIQSVSYWQAAEAIALCLPFSLITAYQFEIANQTTSPAEDKINKPYRPIPAGLLTITQARVRWALSWSLTPCIFYYYLGWEAAGWASLTQACIAFFYVWPAFNNVLCRNAFTATISLPLHRGLNLLFVSTAPELDLSIWADLTLAFWLFSTIHLQEFRDVQGDRLVNRKTLPVVLSPQALRIVQVLTGGLIVAFSIIALLFTTQPPLNLNRTMFWAVQLQLFASLNLAGRLIFNKDFAKSTYHYFYYLTFWTVDFFVVTVAYGLQ